jgi:hypothetical protein
MKISIYIKSVITIYTIFLFSMELQAQGFKMLDNVAHDISYYRENKVVPPLVKVIYGRPKSKENVIFGTKIPFGVLWRTGANEATEIKFYDDVVFGNRSVEAGTYTLVTIPGEEEWEIILSSNLDVWGAFQYDSKADVVRIKVPVSKAENLDVFSIAFKKIKNEVIMVLGWGSTRVKVPMKFEKLNYYAKL